MKRNDQFIKIKGARQHNLKNIDVDFPKYQFTVVTGPSGSGKSSLAFNTLFAEGQRRYLESLSTYARQFLDKQEKPDVDSMEGITPTIAIEQKNHTKSSRSTVGTATEIYDYLRLVYAKMGKMYCPDSGEPVKRDIIPHVVSECMDEHEGQRIYIGFPVTLLATSTFEDRKRNLGSLLERAYTKACPFVEQKPLLKKKKATKKKTKKTKTSKKEKFKIFEIEDELAKKKSVLLGSLKEEQTLFVMADRMSLTPEDRGRFEEAISKSYAEGFGRARVVIVDSKGNVLKDKMLTEFPSTGIGGKRYPELTPALFSFNTSQGACPDCKGVGNLLRVDVKKVVPNENLSIAQGAIDPLSKPSQKGGLKDLLLFCQASKIPLNKPWALMDDDHKEQIWKGHNDFIGLEEHLEQLHADRHRVEIRVFLSRYRSPVSCPSCQGEKLRVEARSVLFHGKTIGELSNQSIEDLYNWFDTLPLTKNEKDIGIDVFPQITDRLNFLLRVGLDYLSLNRLAKTLSGGEAQRIALANQLASRLTQTTYVLDEPSIGLHPRDTEKLVGIIKDLRDLRNTVVVVEHDPDIIKSADYLMDIGPLAGEHGGELVFAGEYKKFIKQKQPNSITAAFMQEKEHIPVPSRRRPTRYKEIKQKIDWIEIKGCREHNLKGVDIKIPRNMLTCVTGVSGSGKSTAIRKTLYPAMCKELLLKSDEPGEFDSIRNVKKIRTIKMIDQQPIGRSPRSNPITYLKSYDQIRQLFASTREARKHRFHPGHFSFNVPGGRCQTCEGEGYIRVEMVFMEDIFIPCDACEGKRFQDRVLKIFYKGKSIYDVLSMTVNEAIEFFKTEARLHRNLSVLKKVGLGYLRLGQPSNTLSGGECQRLKISRELLMSENTDIVYILDEPTTGLHFRDVKILVKVLHELVERGNTVIVIEHNTDVMKAADWMIDFGPGGGVHGGEVVATGTPEDIIKSRKSITGKYLKPVMKASPTMTLTKFIKEA